MADVFPVNRQPFTTRDPNVADHHRMAAAALEQILA
jgi:hypothetical protein